MLSEKEVHCALKVIPSGSIQDIAKSGVSHRAKVNLSKKEGAFALRVIPSSSVQGIARDGQIRRVKLLKKEKISAPLVTASDLTRVIAKNGRVFVNLNTPFSC